MYGPVLGPKSVGCSMCKLSLGVVYIESLEPRLARAADFATVLFAFMFVAMEEGLINPWHACATRVTVVGSVCLCVCPLLNITSRTFVCLAISATYSTGSEGHKVCVVFSENAPLQS